jgi:hypothetical protein
LGIFLGDFKVRKFFHVATVCLMFIAVGDSARAIMIAVPLENRIANSYLIITGEMIEISKE